MKNAMALGVMGLLISISARGEFAVVGRVPLQTLFNLRVAQCGPIHGGHPSVRDPRTAGFLDTVYYECKTGEGEKDITLAFRGDGADFSPTRPYREGIEAYFRGLASLLHGTPPAQSRKMAADQADLYRSLRPPTVRVRFSRVNLHSLPVRHLGDGTVVPTGPASSGRGNSAEILFNTRTTREDNPSLFKEDDPRFYYDPGYVGGSPNYGTQFTPTEALAAFFVGKFFDRDEFYNALVVSAYRMYLGRAPESAAVVANHARNARYSRHPEIYLAVGFLASSEFRAKFSDTNRWREALVTALTGGPASTNERNAWVNRPISDAQASAEAQSVAGRPTAVRHFAHGVFRAALLRHPNDPSGAELCERVVRGEMSQRDLWIAVVASPEGRERLILRGLIP